jgi:hypothetical protein
MPVINSNYKLRVNYILDHKNNTLCQLIHMKISLKKGLFQIRALQEFIEVTDGSTTERPFKLSISPNQKALMGIFAVDAFNSFTTNVEVRFGYLGEGYNSIISPSINTIIGVLPPDVAQLNITQGTKAWLNIS